MLKKKWKIGTLTIEPLGIWVAYGEKNMQDKKTTWIYMDLRIAGVFCNRHCCCF
jgi:hypothetical protein